MTNPGLFEKHVYEILIYVEENRPCQKSDIYTGIGQHTQTTVRIVNRLIGQGLLQESKKGQYNKKLITITETGVQILEHMKRITDIMDGNISPPTENHVQSTSEEIYPRP